MNGIRQSAWETKKSRCYVSRQRIAVQIPPALLTSRKQHAHFGNLPTGPQDRSQKQGELSISDHGQKPDIQKWSECDILYSIKWDGGTLPGPICAYASSMKQVTNNMMIAATEDIDPFTGSILVVLE